MSDPQDLGLDREELAALEALYRQAQPVQPPPELDRRIRAAARQAESVAPASAARRKHSPRWAVPLSLAALLVLSIGLVTLMQQQLSLQPPAPQPVELVLPVPQTAPAADQAPAVTLQAEEPALASPRALTLPEPAARTASEALKSQSFNKIPQHTALEQESAEPQDPQTWLAQIRELRRQGQWQQAEAQLRLLRQRYPDYPIPDAIQR